MLSLYYMAASVIHGWHLALMTSSIKKLIALNGSLVIYKELKRAAFIGKNGLISEMHGISSKSCFNKHRARIDELVWCKGNKRVLSIYPKQRIDLTNWIGFPGVEKNLPCDNKASDISFNENKPISVIIEANDVQYTHHDVTKLCEFQEYGNLQAWKTGTPFSLLLETDISHLAKLGVDFMLDRVVTENIELIRIETVAVEGHPYIKCSNSTSMRKNFGYTQQTFLVESEQIPYKNLPTFEKNNHIYNHNHKPGRSKKQFRTIDCLKETSEDLCSFSETKIISSLPRNFCSNQIASRGLLDTEKIPRNYMKIHSKPPSVLIYSESQITRKNMKSLLHDMLDKNQYTVYAVTQEQLLFQHWKNNTHLLVVSGNVSPELGSSIISYVLEGGKVLCLCSDFLRQMLPMYHTAEVREHELVYFSFDQWKHVGLMHHIFCYQPSPDHKRFFRFEDLGQNPPEKLPSIVLIYDENRMPHELKIDILGTEETWHSPSLIMATVSISGGRVIFSQIHLEISSNEFIQDSEKFRTLQASDSARLGILRELLHTHFGMECASTEIEELYRPGYVLGRHKVKECFVKRLFQGGDTLKLPKLELVKYNIGYELPPPTEKFLPILSPGTPAKFSETEYLKALDTKVFGQVALFADVMTSSMDVLDGVKLQDGFAVITLKQTRGRGRSGNSWISPEGCALFALQMHFSRTSFLGKNILIVQHLAGLAIVSSIASLPGYENLNLRLKWPNDIYVGNLVKIGGILVTSSSHEDVIVCNAGCGLNLNNEAPTTCVNRLIQEYNKKAGTNLECLSLEKYFAIVFNRLEQLLDKVQAGYVSEVLNLYYKFWLHSDAKITVTDSDGASHDVTVVGIDENGFIVVRNHFGYCFSVHPGENSFDLINGLIIPKQTVYI